MARPRLLTLTLAYLAFVSLGLPDTVLGVAWPSLREGFGLPQALLGAPLAASAGSYFLSGLLAGRLLGRLGVGGVLAASTALVTVGVAGYAGSPTFGAFVAAALGVGFGSGAVDTALNGYAAERFGPRHMNWLHAAYSAGAALGPASMTALLAAGAGWRAGYVLIGAALLPLAVAFTLTRGRWDAPAGAAVLDAPGEAGRAVALPVPVRQVLRQPRVWLQVALFFVYTGLESGTGQWSYTVLTESRGVLPTTAGVLVTGYWASLLFGRVLTGFVVERVGNARLVRGATGLVLLGGLVFAAAGSSAVLSALGLWLLGLGLSPIFPGLMAETPRRLGPMAAPHAVGFQVSAATAGVAAIPSGLGLAANGWGLGAVPLLLAGVSGVLVVLHERLVAGADAAAREVRAAGR